MNNIELTHNELGEDANSKTLEAQLKPINNSPKDDDEYTVTLNNATKNSFKINHKNLLSVLQALSKIDSDCKFTVTLNN